jgi:xanthine dehydrogenase iron-sulfur cluster and FAD-binding subunit A
MTNNASNKSFSFILNGRSVTIGDCGVHTLLLDLLRERGLTGAKEVCILEDAGTSLSPIVDRGQIEGGSSKEPAG